METPTFFYKPNFCAECGEKIERENWHFWHSRRFCDDCEPVYRMTRIVPLAMFGAILLFSGIFLSSAGQKYNQVIPKDAPPVIAEKKEPFKPQNLVSKPPSNVENSAVISNLPIEKATPETAPPANSSKPAVVENARAVIKQDVVYTCGARTQKGTPCSRRVKEPGRCWQHVGKPSMLETPKY